MSKITEMLSLKPGDAPKPQALPEGLYQIEITKFQDAVERGDDAIVMSFRGTVTKVVEVDASELDDFGGEDRAIGTGVFVERWIGGNNPELSEYQNSQFFTHCGLDPEGKDYNELIEEVIGSSVLMKGVHDTYEKDGVNQTICRFKSSFASN